MKPDSTRKEKIEFLKGLLQGKKFLTEILPSKVIVLNVLETNPETYLVRKTGETLSRDEYERLRRKHPNWIFVNVTRKIITGNENKQFTEE